MVPFTHRSSWQGVLSPYSQAPTYYDPTQRLRGNPISLNQYLYNNIIIYILFYLKVVDIELKILIQLKISTVNYILINNNFLYNKFKIKYCLSRSWSGGIRREVGYHQYERIAWKSLIRSSD